MSDAGLNEKLKLSGKSAASSSDQPIAVRRTGVMTAVTVAPTKLIITSPPNGGRLTTIECLAMASG